MPPNGLSWGPATTDTRCWSRSDEHASVQRDRPPLTGSDSAGRRGNHCRSQHQRPTCSLVCAGVDDRGVAILLSGVSSAGKTTIGKALQRRLDRLAVFVPADDLDLPRPSKSLDGRSDSELFALQDRLESLYLAVLVTIASRGFHAIGEVFISAPEQRERYRRELAPVQHLLVRVTAPPDVVQARERARGDRYSGTAAGHLARDRSGGGFDVVLDTALLSSESAADLVVARIQAIELGR